MTDLDWDVERSRARRNKRWSQYDRDVIDLTVAEMDLPVAAPILAAVQDDVRRQAFGYPLADELSDVPQAAGEWLAEEHGLTVAPDRVRLLPELMRGIIMSITHLTRADSPVVVPTPVYGRFFDAIRVAGREAVQVPMSMGERGYELDLDGIERALRAGAGSVLLCHPGNPTGRILDVGPLRALAALAARHGAKVISDEIHAPLRYQPGFIPYGALDANAITLISATKAWNFPGLRCGLIVFGDPADARVWAGLPRAAVGGMSPLGMTATVAAFREGRPWLREAVRFLDGNRKLVTDALADLDIGYVEPQASYLAWLDLRRFGLADPAAHLLRETGVATASGADHGSAGDGFVRLNFATPPDVLTDALDRIIARLL
ncbi:MalY/PatB family protein [Nonomuraea endophytica]|uniref:cysteine-S-conjugate beta-lyase n=1 Tax=Nonomuraea endophytica TaxID=714136 RepID=A0A7W8ELD1_9ACTN|nr:aminotransferase class I/II-fold pyridoxal phosphate-dependent enzyme [Nonomuraea endophytica]MBB5085180.1 cystathionine beta-lyase [Nonomuraea endophytica]